MDNAHSLVAKHVESNNKYAETEAILQLELDDLRTDCEQYQNELKAQKTLVQEKDGQIRTLRNAMEEKVWVKYLLLFSGPLKNDLD